MCEIKDLVVMVVDSTPDELQKSCDSLNRIGISRIICTDSYVSAVRALKQNPDIDIIVADFSIEPDKALGLLLCAAAKAQNPSLFFILVSKNYSCSVVLESFKTGAEDILDKNREGDIEDLMLKWVNLARQRNIIKEIINGPSKIS